MKYVSPRSDTPRYYASPGGALPVIASLLLALMVVLTAQFTAATPAAAVTTGNGALAIKIAAERDKDTLDIARLLRSDQDATAAVFAIFTNTDRDNDSGPSPAPESLANNLNWKTAIPRMTVFPPQEFPR